MTTQPASNNDLTSFQLNGSINPGGVATQGYFEWGTSSTLTTSTATATQNLGAGTSTVALHAPLTGLTCGTTYYFRAVAVQGGSLVRGSILFNSTVLC